MPSIADALSVEDMLTSLGLPNGVGAVPWLDDPLYRLCWTDPPRISDFRSKLAKGLPFPNRHNPVLHGGVSMWATETDAAARARPGSLIVKILPPERSTLALAKTLSHGHFTVWGDPNLLLAQARIVGRVAP